ncbi:NMT1/THI5 like protein [Variibacter gotjawalensis]|uniref:NMT1/THI5 like protein n=1 Tax=Variibacter gotjawalensis TaxID=1333996 RepID=A0A0S3Q0L5_9BRAD|nr:ABC transporter substrate-binding protein [Variibacter gotjawalensis]NIK47577.1 NitT/TauT family transport system substrate-binding protein [Variibacter gotjawalensis]RZS49474.1 NitT/TauT family transport system substrate-binding protein [Variibacter gotjawalensis]BAT61737.1 NMT1/THI5 like protein [Variibacter gotjawalensis]
MRIGVTRRECMFLTAAAGLTVAGTGRLRAQNGNPLRLSLDGRLEGPSAPFWVALERGFFKREGLDVSIDMATQSHESISRVASGTYDLGVGDINQMIRFRDQNPSAAMKAVFIVNNQPAYAIVGRKSRGIYGPADLDGKKLGLPAQEVATAQWPIFAKLNSIDISKITVVNVGMPVREPMLAAGEIDAVTGQAFGTPFTLRDKGVPAEDITTMMMSSYGLQLYGNSIFATTKLMAERPDVLQAFLRGLLAGLKVAITDPSSAIDAVMRRNNGASRDVELERLLTVVRYSMMTADVRMNGLGDIRGPRMDTALEQLAIGYTFKNKPKVEDIFDARFLPPEDDRKIS